MKKLFIGLVSTACLTFPTLFSASAATVDLPDAFSELTGIFETLLRIVEFLSRILSLFA